MSSFTIGIDEAGRGCWAGPLVAAAVELDESIPMPEWITDSKQLSRQRRKQALSIIQRQAVGIGIGWVAAETIDEVGLTQATTLAMNRALNECSNLRQGRIIIDGNYNYLADIEGVETLVKADALVGAVACASIVAKVLRDRYMAAASRCYPYYGFETHAGYGTKEHHLQLLRHGVSSLHRRSFKPVAATGL